MGSFIAFEEKMEVNGGTIMAVVDGLGVFARIAQKILEEN